MTNTYAPRIARIARTTKESDITVELDLDGTGVVDELPAAHAGLGHAQRPGAGRQHRVHAAGLRDGGDGDGGVGGAVAPHTMDDAKS